LKKNKLNFKELYPLLWNQYQFLVQQRQKLDDTINYLMALNSLILLVYLQIYNINISQVSIYLIPIIFLFLIPIIIFFKNFLPQNLYLHFVELINIKKTYDGNGNIYETFVRDIMGVIPHLKAYRDFKRRIIILLLNSLYLGLLCIVFIHIYCSDRYYYLLLVLLIGFGLLWYLNAISWKKEYVKKEEIKKNNTFIEGWLK